MKKILPKLSLGAFSTLQILFGIYFFFNGVFHALLTVPFSYDPYSNERIWLTVYFICFVSETVSALLSILSGFGIIITLRNPKQRTRKRSLRFSVTESILIAVALVIFLVPLLLKIDCRPIPILFDVVFLKPSYGEILLYFPLLLLPILHIIFIRKFYKTEKGHVKIEATADGMTAYYYDNEPEKKYFTENSTKE